MPARQRRERSHNRGREFQSGAAVTFGGTPATGVTVTSSTSISATTPAHAAGTVNVVVANTTARAALSQRLHLQPDGANPSLDLAWPPGGRVH